ncbi:unnamed protein product [Trichogramma brassicae]|uniref:Uncharacterized protein n=1 Tax=Trichogramma brassicae TaxID=86971 RepID=A0A6H5HVS2_9HYME|nr:unnamed protein product [Trichogramma brassicae]
MQIASVLPIVAKSCEVTAAVAMHIALKRMAAKQRKKIERKSKTLRVGDALILSLCTCDETRKHIHSDPRGARHIRTSRLRSVMMEGGEPMGRRQVTTATAAPRRYNMLFLILLLLPLLRQARAKGKCLRIRRLRRRARRLAGFFIAAPTALCSRRAKQKQSREQNKRRAASEQAKHEDTHAAAAAIVRSSKRALPRVVQIHARRRVVAYTYTRASTARTFVWNHHPNELARTVKGLGCSAALHFSLSRNNREFCSIPTWGIDIGGLQRLPGGGFQGVQTADELGSPRRSRQERTALRTIFQKSRKETEDVFNAFRKLPVSNSAECQRTPRYALTVLFHLSNSNYTSSLFPDLRCKDNAACAPPPHQHQQHQQHVVKRLIDFLLQAHHYVYATLLDFSRQSSRVRRALTS